MTQEEYERRYSVISDMMKSEADHTSHYANFANGDTRVFDESIIMKEAAYNYAMPHTHDFLELAYVANGSAGHFCADTVTHIKKGDYFIVDYGVRHAYVSDESDGRLSVVNCLFLPRFIDRTLSASLTFNQVLSNYLIRFGDELNIVRIGDVVFTDEDGRVGEIISNMMKEYDEKKSGYLEVLRCNLVEIIVTTMRRYSAKMSIPECGDAVSEVKKYVDENYMHNITLSHISRVLKISVSHMSRLFREETGMLFSEYLQKVRIEHSCRILANTDKKVIDAAQLVGYDDIKFFGSVFKRFMNMTPSEYRRAVADSIKR